MARIALTYETLVDGKPQVCPYSPITEFGEWYAFDKKKADKCMSMLAALEQWSSESSPAEQDATHEAAINEICALNVTGYFRKYIESDADDYRDFKNSPTYSSEDEVVNEMASALN